MATDILGGVQMGYRTILTLTGSTERSQLDECAYSPAPVIESIAELEDPKMFLAEHLPPGRVADDTVHDLDAWSRSSRVAAASLGSSPG